VNSIKACLAAILCTLMGQGLFAETSLYVAPNGSDANSGSMEQPLATLEKALTLARSARAGRPAEPVTVYLRSGIHFLSRPLVLTPEDSGVEGAPLTFRSYGEENPVLSGGRLIKGWKKKQVNKRPMWVTELEEVKTGAWSFHQLWIDGVRHGPARHPNQGYLQVQRLAQRSEQSQWSEGDVQFGYAADDLPPGLVPGDEIVVMNRWVESRLPIQRIDKDGRMLYFSKQSLFRLDEKDLYYVENAFSALDQPGEWYLDRKKGLLYYMPKEGEDPATLQVIAPRLTSLLCFQGNPDSSRYVQQVLWQNITFSHTEWYFPADFKSTWSHARPDIEVGGFPQAAVGVVAAIYGQGCRFIEMNKCRLLHLGGYGVEWARACSHNRLRHCEIGDLAAGGVKIGETVLRPSPADQTHDQEVLDCHIHDGGRVFHSAIGIWIGQSYNNRIIHNHIHDFYYTGISIGWTWGYGEALAAANRVELNHVHHIGVLSNGDGPILSDMAGIYTLGAQPGTLIRQNLFHDIAGLRYGGWGIYFDEGSTYILAEENLVYRTTHGGFHQHYGKENIVRNNIFCHARNFQIQRSRREEHTSFSFEKNIVYWNSGKLLEGRFDDFHFLFDHNLYWQANRRPICFDTLSFSAWQNRGMDRHSIIADPLFLDADHDDFRLQPDSPAFQLGFEPIPIHKVFQPWSEVQEQMDEPAVRPRSLYQQDLMEFLSSRDTVTVEDIHRLTDEAANAGVTTLVLSAHLGQNLAWPSRTADVFTYGDRALRRSKTDSMHKKCSDNLHRLLQAQQDPIELFLRRARLRGLEGVISLRMNDRLQIDRSNSPLLSAFWKQYPAYRLSREGSASAYAFNFAVDQVRDYYLSLLREACERYPLDGIELDFSRYPLFLSQQEKNSAIMNRFIEQVRALTREIGDRRNHSILVSARIPSTLQGCTAAGLAVADWCRFDWVDFLTVVPLQSTDTEIPVWEFKAVCDRTPVYAMLGGTLGGQPMAEATVRAAAATLFDNGAEGMYLSSTAAIPLDVFKGISSMEVLASQSKLYAWGPGEAAVNSAGPNGALPIALSPGQPRAITLHTPETKGPKAVYLWLQAKEKLDPDRVYVELNDQSLELIASAQFAWPFTLETKPPFHTADRVLTFSVSPSWLQSVNQLLVVAETRVTLEYVYLGVIH